MMKRAFSLAALLLGTVLLTACTQPEPQESSVAEETTAVTTEAVTTAPPPTAKELRRALIESIKVGSATCLDDVLAADAQAREFAYHYFD